MDILKKLTVEELVDLGYYVSIDKSGFKDVETAINDYEVLAGETYVENKAESEDLKWVSTSIENRIKSNIELTHFLKRDST